MNVTDTAIKNIIKLQNEYDAVGFGLRFGITGGGCSGYKYIIEFENTSDEDDIVFKFDGIDVFVKKSHMDKLKNSTIDWSDSLMESGFKIDNPQAKRPCGCGESVDFS
jgi:iron-sulfur cluster assembly accessory protein